MSMLSRFVPAALSVTLVTAWAAAAGPAQPSVSGLKPGRRVGPYAAVISVGPTRGEPHCYVCETADRPAVIVFARGLDDPLGKLVRGLDRALADHQDAELRAWVTFLHEDQPAFDPQVVSWARSHAVRYVPLGVFEDRGGPPSYRLSPDAAVTVLLCVKQRVVRNFAFRPGELTDARIAEVLAAVPSLLPKK
jgi:hypothetical protein